MVENTHLPVSEADTVAPSPAPRTASFEAALAAIRNAWDASRRADPPPRAAPAKVTIKPATVVQQADIDGGCVMTAPQPEPVASPQPVQDEWGLFDPNRCGFAAVVEKLNEAPDEADPKKERTTMRVISYS